MTSTALVDIGMLLSGDLETPILDGDTVRVVDGRIDAIGDRSVADGVERVIGVRGATVGPGLIDSHCHVVLGDFTPRQNTVGFLSSYVHGGITHVVSPGEIHAPGRPHDRVGVKALAILAQRSWQVYRPNGMKVLGGSIVLEPSLQPEDFFELASEGVRTAKFGFGLYTDPLDGAAQVSGAQAAGLIVMCHSGGASIPGSQPIGPEHLLALRPDVCGHLNGGPTSLAEGGLATIVRDTDMVLQLVQAGCLRSSLHIVDLVREFGAEHRVILGSDTPMGTGVMPLGMLKTIAELCSLGGVEPAVAWAWATGVTADVYGLDTGKIEVGRAADICVSDAPWGSQAADTVGALYRGDIPGVTAVLIDGEIRALRSRNTPEATCQVDVEPHPGELPGSSHV